MREHGIYRITAFDVTLVVLILLFSIGAIIHIRLQNRRQPLRASVATLYYKGALVNNLKLDKDQEVPFLNGKMIIAVKKGRVRVNRSDCPCQTCVRIGWIHFPGETIACVPNNVMVRIIPSDATMVDAVVY